MITNNVSIDIIIPVKERYKLLLNALNSIEKQSLKPNKVWIIDDCSTEKLIIFQNLHLRLKLLEI